MPDQPQPDRPKCRFHADRYWGGNDCDLCRGTARQATGDEFHDGWFGTTPVRYTAYPGQGRAGLGKSLHAE